MEYVSNTHRVRVLDLPTYFQLIFAYDGHHISGVNHVLVLFIAEPLVVALHKAMEAGAEEMHVLRVHCSI